MIHLVMVYEWRWDKLAGAHPNAEEIVTNGNPCTSLFTAVLPLLPNLLAEPILSRCVVALWKF